MFSLNTKAHGLLTIYPRAMPIHHHRTLAARGLMDIPQGRPSYILVCKFSNRQVRLSKNIIIAECTPPPDVIHAVELNDHETPQIWTPKVDINPSHLSFKLRNDISAVNYKPTDDKESQISRHSSIQDDDSSRLAQDWHNEVHLSDKYSAYRD